MFGNLRLPARLGVFVPLAGQGGISATNLLIGLALIREGTPVEYGLYVLGFSIALFFVAIQEGLVAVPLMVRAGGSVGTQRMRNLRSHRRSLHSVVLGAVIVGLAGYGLLHSLFPATADPAFAAAVACFGAGYIAWDFQRVEAIANKRPVHLLLIDCTYIFVILIWLVLLVMSGAVTGAGVLGSMACAGVLAALVGMRGSPALEFRLRRIGLRVRGWWVRGRVSLAAGMVTWVQSQGYIYLCSALLGLATLAQVAAARLLFAPIATLLTGWVKATTTSAAENFRRGEYQALRRRLRLSAMAFGILCLGWGALMIALEDLVRTTLFKGKFESLGPLIMAWAVAFMANCMRTLWQLNLRALARFDSLLKIACLGALLSTSSAVLAMQWLGGLGAVLGFALGEATVAVIASRVLAVALRRQRKE